MENQRPEEAAGPATFGRRKVVPRVCVADRKQHIRTFIQEALEELGFITCECAQVGELGAVLDEHLPDLVVLGLSAGGIEAGEMLNTLAAKEFGGMVLLLSPRDSAMAAGVRELGEKLGLAMLPMLSTPFDSGELRDSVAALLPIEAPNPVVDVAEALRAGWLELWYQPKIDTHTLALRGAEALIRMRHPYWGVVEPACFIPDDGDPHFQALSQFVISQTIADWRYLLTERGSVDISINLPISFLQNPASLGYLYQQLPDHPAFEGLIVEINATEIIRNLSLARDIAKQVRFHKIAISIDDLGAEWPSLVELHDFPFVEIKVDREFISGCADDRLKRTVCRQIIDLADHFGARTVAEGVETRADFLAVSELGFDLIQGFLFGKPMGVRKFARTMLRHLVTARGDVV
jgi:EAL domain-containing protein (putative c-di-GMP-specific phosphodiesterase class I)